MKSYLLPYTILGFTAGATLLYTTEKLVFLPICFCGALGLGMLRDANVENGESQNIGNNAIKATAIYILGPMSFIIAGGLVLSIVHKK